ncbi:MAG: c-type cytochrome biogenesis protein CcsB [Deltaproteobacteria bacterium]|nr:c-type cytochrome biogenesis protein CcsB [Deltaproteobacteria bacterium]
MSKELFLAALICYLTGTLGYLLYVVLQEEVLHRVARYILLFGFILHASGFVVSYIQTGFLPVSTFRNSLSFFALAIIGAYLLIQARFNLMILGSFVSPLASMFMIFAALTPQAALPASPLLKSLWLTVHVSFVFLGLGIFTVAFAAAIMYLIQERHLKRKRFSPLYRRLPSLDVLDAVNYYCLVSGFPLLTIGLIIGSIYAQMALGKYWRWDPKEVWSLSTWFFYAVLLHERLTVGWRGRRAAIMAVIGFAAILFTYMGVNHWLKGYHSFSGLQAIK